MSLPSQGKWSATASVWVSQPWPFPCTLFDPNNKDSHLWLFLVLVNLNNKESHPCPLPAAVNLNNKDRRESSISSCFSAWARIFLLSVFLLTGGNLYIVLSCELFWLFYVESWTTIGMTYVWFKLKMLLPTYACFTTQCCWNHHTSTAKPDDAASLVQQQRNVRKRPFTQTGTALGS